MSAPRYRDPFIKRTTSAALEAAVADAEKPERLFSLTQAALLLGRNRSTLTEWRKKKMPVEKEGETGDSTVVDLKRVVDWMVERAVDEERRRYATPDPAADPSEIPLTTKERIELAKLAGQTMKNAKDAGFLVPRPIVEAAFERCLGIVRISVMAVPERLVREMSGFPEEKKTIWRKKAIRSCASALDEAARSIVEAMRDFDPGAEVPEE